MSDRVTTTWSVITYAIGIAWLVSLHNQEDRIFTLFLYVGTLYVTGCIYNRVTLAYCKTAPVESVAVVHNTKRQFDHVPDEKASLCVPCSALDLGFFFEDYPEAEHTKIRKKWVARHEEPLGPDCPLCRLDRTYNSLYDTSITTFRLAPRYKYLAANHPIGDSRFDNHGVIVGRKVTQEEWHSPFRVMPLVDFSMVRDWLKVCRDNDDCDSSDSPLTGIYLKVVDCESRMIVPYTRDMGGYLALSYVWGQGPHTPFAQDERLGELHETLEDAIAVVKRIGYRYLWIDRFCIPQDDPRQKQQQIQRMGDIYTQAKLTIVAAAGDDPSYGLPGVNDRPRRKQGVIRLGDNVLVFKPAIDYFVATSKWDSRGWTFQEGLLSKRLLVFTDDQVYFQCSVRHYHESDGLPTSPDIGTSDPELPTIEKQADQYALMRHVESFWFRSLSYDRDALDAMRGIFRRFSNQPGPILAIYGLPLYLELEARGKNVKRADLMALIDALLWRLPRFWKFQGALFRRPGLPSWCSAGWCIRKGDLEEQFPWQGPPMQAYTPRLDDPSGHCSIRFIFDDLALDWERDRAAVFEADLAGKIPDFLEITGWAFEAVLFGNAEDALLCPETARHHFALRDWTISFYAKSVPWLEKRCKGVMTPVLCMVLTDNRDAMRVLYLSSTSTPNVYERFGHEIFRTCSRESFDKENDHSCIDVEKDGEEETKFYQHSQALILDESVTSETGHLAEAIISIDRPFDTPFPNLADRPNPFVQKVEKRTVRIV